MCFAKCIPEKQIELTTAPTTLKYKDAMKLAKALGYNFCFRLKENFYST